jgi:hypothetical protein
MREEILTRNGIKKGDEVIFTGPSRVHQQHGQFAQSLLKKGKAYIVEFVFPGDDFEQIELLGEPEHLFIHDQFLKIGPR